MPEPPDSRLCRRRHSSWRVALLGFACAGGVAPLAHAGPPLSHPLREYLSRPRAPQTRALDHGTLAVEAHGGNPHGYRLALALGLLDHLTVGLTAHWWPGSDSPRWAPSAALTLWNAQRVGVGASYDQILHPPAGAGLDPDDFEGRTHYVLGALELFQEPFSVAVEAGVAHTRLPPVGEAGSGAFRSRVLPAGGIALRVGTRRWGVVLRGRMPSAMAELGVDVRFGLFEFRPSGGWRVGAARSRARPSPNRPEQGGNAAGLAERSGE
jgi:hypothetical protein